MIVRRAFLRTLLLTLSLLTPLAFGHGIHASTAEVDYRRDAAALEIAIRFNTDDLEAALAQRSGKKISVTQSSADEVDPLMSTYVRDTFVVRTADGTHVLLKWVGRELKDADQHVWVYLEGTLPAGLNGTRFAHRSLRDVFSDQLNAIRVRDLGPPMRQKTLLFTRDAEQSVTFK